MNDKISIEDLDNASTTPEPTAETGKQDAKKRIISLPVSNTAWFDAKLKKDLLRGEKLGLNLNRFKKIDKALDGLQDGFYLIGARENAGKTMFLCNLFLDTLESNQTATATEKPVFGLFFSMDDTKDTIANRFIAIQTDGHLFINKLMKPASLPDNEYFNNPNTHKQTSSKDYYKQATAKMRELCKNFYIFDSEEIQDINDIQHLITLTKAQHPDKKIVVFIDSIFNLDLSTLDQTGDRQEHIERAKQLKQLTKTYSLPLVCTVELRKEQKDKEALINPSTSAIMESGKYAYNADLVFMLWYNDKQIKQFEEEDSGELKVTLSYAKNKLSAIKNSSILNFKRSCAYMTEESEEQKEERISLKQAIENEKKAKKEAKEAEKQAKKAEKQAKKDGE